MSMRSTDILGFELFDDVRMSIRLQSTRVGNRSFTTTHVFVQIAEQRFLLVEQRHRALAPDLGGGQGFHLAGQEQFAVLHLVPLLWIQLFAPVVPAAGAVGTISLLLEGN